MKKDVNQVCVSGAIVEGPTCAKTTKGASVSNFTLDVRRNGEVSDFIPCTAFGEVAEKVERMKAGDRIRVGGWLATHRVVKKDGDWFKKTEIRVDEVEEI